MEAQPAVPDDISVHELHVDTHSLRTFGDFMRRELAENIAPMAARVAPTLANGAIVAPHLASGDIEAMNYKHADCIEQMRLQLQSYTTNMAIIADAATAIAARYTSSDALAGASLNGIAPAVNSAIGQNVGMPPDTPHGGVV